MDAIAPETLRTARLSLERMREDHLEALHAMHRDPRVMERIGGVRSFDETRAYLDHQLHVWERDGFGLWIARETATGRFAGRGGLRRIVSEERDETELAYALVPEAWGRGLATELASASLDVGFGVLGLSDVIATTRVTHAASRRVMAKLGLAYERHVFRKGADHVLMRITAAAWRARRGRGPAA